MPEATTRDGEIPCNPGTPAEAAASKATATPVGMAPPAAWVKNAAIPRWANQCCARSATAVVTKLSAMISQEPPKSAAAPAANPANDAVTTHRR